MVAREKTRSAHTRPGRADTGFITRATGEVNSILAKNTGILSQDTSSHPGPVSCCFMTLSGQSFSICEVMIITSDVS